MWAPATKVAATDEYDGDNAVVLVALLNVLRNAFGHAGTERVNRRVIDSDNGDVTISCDLDKFVHLSLFFHGMIYAIFWRGACSADIKIQQNRRVLTDEPAA
jgi:hypothetical protein